MLLKAFSFHSSDSKVKLMCFLKVFKFYSSLANDIFASSAIKLFKYLLNFIPLGFSRSEQKNSSMKNMSGTDFRINQSLQTYKLGGIRFENVTRFIFKLFSELIFFMQTMVTLSIESNCQLCGGVLKIIRGHIRKPLYLESNRNVVPYSVGVGFLIAICGLSLLLPC